MKNRISVWERFHRYMEQLSALMGKITAYFKRPEMPDRKSDIKVELVSQAIIPTKTEEQKKPNTQLVAQKESSSLQKSTDGNRNFIIRYISKLTSGFMSENKRTIQEAVSNIKPALIALGHYTTKQFQLTGTDTTEKLPEIPDSVIKLSADKLVQYESALSCCKTTRGGRGEKRSS